MEIIEHYGFYGIVTREILRDDIATGSQRGIILAHLVFEAKLVPPDVMVEFIKERMLSNLQGYRGFFISGFPKEKQQSKYFDKHVRPPDLVLYLLVRNSLLMDRIVAKTFLVTERYGRNFEHMKTRIKDFNKLIKPALTYYRRQLIVIDGEREETEVFSDICEVIDEFLETSYPHMSMTRN